MVQDDGLQHYRALGLSTSASPDDIKQAYRRLARATHPDKGGSAATFAALQAAYETLSDPQCRAAYDALARDLRFRPGAAAPYTARAAQQQQGAEGPSQPAPGVTEAVLLQQLLREGGSHPGAVFDPTRQLCVTCEVCRRPATQQCWTCSMDLCDFCTRRQHWKGPVALHWPLVNRPGSMLEQLGRRELELKRQQDGQAYKEAQPGYRPQAELNVLRQFQDTMVDLLAQLEAATTPATSAPAQRMGAAGNSSSAGTSSSSSGNSGSSTGTASRGAFGSNTTGPITAAATAVLASSSTSSTSSSSKGGQGHGTSAPLPSQPSAFAMRHAGSNNLAATGSTPGTSTSTSTSTAIVAPGSSSSLVLPRIPAKPAANRCYTAWCAASEAARLALLGRYHNSLARFYMWTQTECSVLLAVHLPTGGTKVPPRLLLEPTPTTLLVQHRGFAPVLNRSWAHPIDTAAGVSSWLSVDGQLLLLQVAKAVPDRAWSLCFKGDPHMARCLQSPYRLLQLPSEVQLELPLPHWVQPGEDVQVVLGTRGLCVMVDGALDLQRTYWLDAAQAARQGGSYKVVDIATSSWCILDQQPPGPPVSAVASQHAGTGRTPSSSPASNTTTGSSSSSSNRARRADKLLSISLVLPEPTEEEVKNKKGVRQDNAAAPRACPNGAGRRGCAFFVEDEDEFGLQALLQALQFHISEAAWLCPTPWELAGGGAGSRYSTNARLQPQAEALTPLDSHSGSGGGQAGAHALQGRGGVGGGGGPGSDPSASYQGGRWVRDERLLPAEVAAHLKWLRGARCGGGGGDGGDGGVPELEGAAGAAAAAGVAGVLATSRVARPCAEDWMLM